MRPRQSAAAELFRRKGKKRTIWSGKYFFEGSSILTRRRFIVISHSFKCRNARRVVKIEKEVF